MAEIKSYKQMTTPDRILLKNSSPITVFTRHFLSMVVNVTVIEYIGLHRTRATEEDLLSVYRDNTCCIGSPRTMGGEAYRLHTSW